MEVPGSRVRAGRDVRAVLAVAVVALALASWFAVADIRLRAAGQDAAETEVTRQISGAVRTVFSHDYNRLDQSRQAALAVLSGPAAEQYEQAMAAITPAAKLVVFTSVRSIGLTELHGDSARALVFVDGQTLRVTDNHRTTTSASLTVSARRIDGVWRLTDIVPG
jgi:Mce-associated membrane protein